MGSSESREAIREVKAACERHLVNFKDDEFVPLDQSFWESLHKDIVEAKRRERALYMPIIGKAFAEIERERQKILVEKAKEASKASSAESAAASSDKDKDKDKNKQPADGEKNAPESTEPVGVRFKRRKVPADSDSD